MERVITNDTIYIGDAVYAHFDGYGIELKLNDHRNECAIYLEPEVMQNLIYFWTASQKGVTHEARD